MLTNDVMFSSRVTSAARTSNASVEVAQTTGVLSEREDVSLAMIDLELFPIDKLASLVSELRQRSAAIHIVAYGPHVDDALLAAARDAGCDRVLTKGQFSQQINSLLGAGKPTSQSPNDE